MVTNLLLTESPKWFLKHWRKYNLKAFFLDATLPRPLYFQSVSFAVCLRYVGQGCRSEEEQPGGHGSTPCDRRCLPRKGWRSCHFLFSLKEKMPIFQQEAIWGQHISFFQPKLHSEIQTYLCQRITRSDRGPNLSVQWKMRQIYFTPGDGFSIVQELLTHSCLTLQVTNSYFQVYPRSLIKSSNFLF